MAIKVGYDYRPRFSVLLNDDQVKRLNRSIPWGWGRKIFSELLDSLLTAVETAPPGKGELILAAILTKRIDIVMDLHLEGIRGMMKAKREKEGLPSED